MGTSRMWRMLLTGLAMTAFAFAGNNNAVAQDCADVVSGAIGWWPGEESNGTAIDLIAGRNGSGQFQYSPAAPVGSSTFLFDGVNERVAVDDDPAWFLGSDDFTIEFWAKLHTLEAFNVFVGQSEGGGNTTKWAIYHRASDSKLVFEVNRPGVGFFEATGNWSPTGFQTNTWRHVAVQRQGNLLRIFTDGDLTTEVTNAGSLFMPDVNAPLTIGGSESIWIDGQVDEVTIYQRFLSTPEIQSIVAAGSTGKCRADIPPPVCAELPEDALGWWSGELDPSGEGIDKIDGRNATGNFQVGTDRGDGYFRITNINERPWIDDDPVFAFGDSDFTLETWFRFHDINLFNPFLGQSEGSGNQPKWVYYYRSANQNLRFDIYRPGQPEWFRTVTVPGGLDIDIWYHIAITREQGTLFFYLNGQLLGSHAGAPTVVDINADVGIGGAEDSWSNGDFDEATIYTRALTASEIRGIYLAGDEGKCEPIVLPPQVTFELNDGVSTDYYATSDYLPRFEISLNGSPLETLPQGGVTLLALGETYDVEVILSRNGVDRLTRTESFSTSISGPQTQSYTWETASLTWELTDDAAPANAIVGAEIDVASSGRAANGTTTTLPVTNEAAGGPDAGGYEVRFYPLASVGIDMERVEIVPVLSDGSSTSSFVWPLRPVTVAVTDDLATEIPGSSWQIPGDVALVAGPINSGDVSPALPVTEAAGFTVISEYAGGYPIEVLPGVNGGPTSELYATLSNSELDVNGLTLDFVWPTVSGNLHIVDANGLEVADAEWDAFFGTGLTGTNVTIPVTEDASLTPAGSYADGYPVTLKLSGGESSGPVAFEFQSDQTVTPAFVMIDGQDYGLRFDVVPAVGSIVGTVTGNEPAPDTPLWGVSIAAYDLANGDLVDSAITDSSGMYTIDDLTAGDYQVSVVLPLGFEADPVDVAATVVGGITTAVDYSLTGVILIETPRARSYWRHEVAKIVKNIEKNKNKPTDYTPEEMMDLIGLIDHHFGQNDLNPISLYQDFGAGTQLDSLKALRTTLAGREADFPDAEKRLRKAKGQLMALMLNVVSSQISQTSVISLDGATVSQAITWGWDAVSGEILCSLTEEEQDENLEPELCTCLHQRARKVLRKINRGKTVKQNLIPLDTPVYTYRNPNEVKFSLQPSPFSDQAAVIFGLAESTPVRVEAFDVAGRRVTVILNESLDAGVHEVNWNGRDENGNNLAPGVYYVRLTEAGSTMVKRIVRLR